MNMDLTDLLGQKPQILKNGNFFKSQDSKLQPGHKGLKHISEWRKYFGAGSSVKSTLLYQHLQRPAMGLRNLLSLQMPVRNGFQNNGNLRGRMVTTNLARPFLGSPSPSGTCSDNLPAFYEASEKE